MDYIQTVSGGVYPYNSRIFGYDFYPVEKPYGDYLTKMAQKQDLYDALHLQNSTNDPIVSDGEVVGRAYKDDVMLSYASTMEALY